MGFFQELKRRNVYKVAVAYIVAGWALAQGIAQVLPVFEVSNWVVRLLVLLIILGLPVALVLAWVFEMTPEGIVRTDALPAGPAHARPKKRTWIYVVIAGAVFSIGLFLLGRYTANSTSRSSIAGDKSIAVLPLVNQSGDPAQEYSKVRSLPTRKPSR